MRRPARLAAGLLGWALIGGGLLGCGVAPNDHDRPLNGQEVPFGLLSVSSIAAPRPVSAGPVATSLPEPLGPTSSTTPTVTYELSLFFVADSELLRVRRPAGVEPTVNLALPSLLQGPQPQDPPGLRSALLDPGVVLSATSSGGQAAVDLGPPFSALLGSEQLLAIAQITFTLTAIAGIGTVAFTLGGVALQVPRSDGELITGPLSRDDLRQLAPDETVRAPNVVTATP